MLSTELSPEARTQGYYLIKDFEARRALAPQDTALIGWRSRFATASASGSGLAMAALVHSGIKIAHPGLSPRVKLGVAAVAGVLTGRTVFSGAFGNLLEDLSRLDTAMGRGLHTLFHEHD